MYKPDHVIVRKIREYDPHLFVEWNSRKEYFEVWRHMPHGRRLITPVTASIYDVKGLIEFTPLDERILWWLEAADSWRHGGSKKHASQIDSRWREIEIKKDSQLRATFHEIAKDVYGDCNNFYATKHASKNRGRPNLNRPRNTFVRPDVQSKSRQRIMHRSKANALRYGFTR